MTPPAKPTRASRGGASHFAELPAEVPAAEVPAAEVPATSPPIVECKHWSKPVGVDELRSFLWKMHNRYGRCRLGFFVTTQRFTEPFHGELRRGSMSKVVVIAIDGATLERLITSHDRNEVFKALHKEAVIGSGGGHPDAHGSPG